MSFQKLQLSNEKIIFVQALETKGMFYQTCCFPGFSRTRTTLSGLPLPGVGVLTTVGCGVLGVGTAFIRGLVWGTAVGVRAWEGGRSYFWSWRR